MNHSMPYAHIPPSWQGSLSSQHGDVDISVNMIVKNEEPRLARALASLIPLKAKEIIVGDTGSTDRTKEVAEWFGAKVIDVPWRDHFADARNAVLDASMYEWIVWIDGDEQFAEGSAERLRTKVKTNQLQADYQLFVFSEYPFELSQTRMFRKIPSARWKGRVHEQVWPDGPVQSHEDITILQYPDERRADKYMRNLMLLDKSIEEEPLQASNHLHASILRILVKDYRLADHHAQMYLRLSPKDALKPRVYMLYTRAWIALMQRKDLQAAANLIASGLAMDITAAELWCLLGDTYQWAKRPQDALAAYENAIEFGTASTGTFWIVDKSKYDVYPRQMIEKLASQGFTRPKQPRMSFGPETP